MARGNRLTFAQYRPNEMVVSDMLQQQMLQARLEAGDDGLVKHSREQFKRSFVNRPYTESAGARSQVVSSLYRQARREAIGAKDSALGQQALAVAAAPIQQGTSKLLQQAWLTLIDSWGATLIWINIHVFLKWTVGEQFFCKLGREWLPSAGKPGAAAATKGTASSSLLGIPAGGLGLLEAGVLGFLNLLVLLILFAIVAFCGLIVYMWTHPVESFWAL